MSLYTTTIGRIEVHQHVGGESTVVWSRDNLDFYKIDKVQRATNTMAHDTSPEDIRTILDIIEPEKT